MSARTWLAALALLAVGGFVCLASDRDDATKPAITTSEIAGLRTTPVAPSVPLPSRDHDDSARTAALPLRAWFYAVERDAERTPAADGYVLIQELTEPTRAELAPAAGPTPSAGRCAIAVEHEGMRQAWSEETLTHAANTLARRRSEAGPLLSFQVVDAASDEPMTVLVVDESGRPYGPVWSGLSVALPRGFHGYALAHGYLPTKVASQDPGPLVWIAMHRGCHVRGRLVGQPVAAGARLHLEQLYASPTAQSAPESDTAAVGPDGAFEIGPIAAGRRQLRYDGERAWLASEARLVELRPGTQDLGTLRLLAMPELHLRVFGNAPSIGRQVFVTVWFAGREPPARLGVTERELPPDGRLCLPRVRDVPLSVCAWTRTGWLASAEPVLGVETSAEHPAPLHLQPPGTLRIHASTAPQALPEGCRVLVSPGVFRPGQLRLLARKNGDESERVRLADVQPDGTALLESLWKGQHDVALLSPEGALLARTEVDVPAGASVSVDLRPADALALLVVDNDADQPRRFAVLSDALGVVLRGEVVGSGCSRVLLPAGTYRVIELRGPSAAVGVEPARASIEIAGGASARLAL